MVFLKISLKIIKMLLKSKDLLKSGFDFTLLNIKTFVFEMSVI